MRITELEIKNFRQYKSLNISFPRKSDNDLHVIVADNGIGKTNILNAITWCLYNEETHLGNKSKSLPKLNTQALEEAKIAGKDVEDISVIIKAEDETKKIQFVKTMGHKISSNFDLKPVFKVFIDSGKPEGAEILVDEKAVNFVQKLLPSRIQQYFFFDGEHLQHYFLDDANLNIKDTIHNISQVDILKTTEEHLQSTIKAMKTETGAQAPDIKKVTEELNNLEQSISAKEKRKTELLNEIGTLSKQIDELSQKLKGSEQVPELENRLSELMIEHEKIINKQTLCQKEFFDFIVKKIISVSMYPYAKETYDMICEKEAQNTLPPNIDKTMLLNLLNDEHGSCVVCGSELSDDSKEHIRILLESIQVSSKTSNILMSIKSELKRTIDDAIAYEEEKNILKTKYSEILNDLKKNESDIRKVESEYQKFSDQDQIKTWFNERKEKISLRDDDKQEQAIVDYEINKDKKLLEEKNKSFEKILASNEKYKQNLSRINFANEASLIINLIENEMMDEIREKMENRTLEIFDQLVWKKNFYKSVKLDDRYQMDLFDVNGISCSGSCSAAERALLALSFTLALHEISGFDSLLFIDTPVARISGDNRSNFAKVLKEVSLNKQLIMTFTPDEYSSNVSDVFEPIASTSRHLTMNDSNNITTIVE